MRVLYIEDDPIDRMAFERLVAPMEQLHIDFARDLASFQQLYAQNTYALFISDFFVGIDTGMEIADLIAPKSIIFLTGLPKDELPVEQLPHNLIGVYSKPLEFDELLLILDGIPSASELGTEDLTNDLKAVKTLEYLVQHSPKIKAEVLSVFQETLTDTLPELKQLLQNREYEQISLVAHRLKSLFRTLGVHRLLEQANQLEVQCKSMIPAPRLDAAIERWISNIEKVLRQSQLR